MRFKLAVAAIAATSLAFGGITLASASSDEPSDGEAGRTVKLFALTVQTADVDLGASGFSLGDQQIFADDLSAKEGGQSLGSDGGACTVVRVTDAGKFSGTVQCVATLSLSGGQIATQGLLTITDGRPPASFDIAITGGTGAYRGAGGVLAVQEISPTKANLTLHLSGTDD